MRKPSRVIKDRLGKKIALQLLSHRRFMQISMNPFCSFMSDKNSVHDDRPCTTPRRSQRNVLVLVLRAVGKMDAMRESSNVFLRFNLVRLDAHDKVGKYNLQIDDTLKVNTGSETDFAICGSSQAGAKFKLHSLHWLVRRFRWRQRDG